jgi:methylthioribose-1-phosphate isomerase
VALAACAGAGEAGVAETAGLLAGARPTAVNLAWGVHRALAAYRGELPAAGDREPGPAAALAEARAIEAEDAAASRAMAAHGLTLVTDGARILTHCNTGALVSGGEGTAFAVILAAHRAGRLGMLWVDETRPLLQGARLTAYEAKRAGLPFQVLPDAAAASLMASGQVDMVLVGADRIAADGSVANKVGSYGLAVLARHHRVPFVVAAPLSTIDFSAPGQSAIVVEHRPAREVTDYAGITVAPAGSDAYNPAFDVTPAPLVTALVTERGVTRPVNEGMLRVLSAETAAGHDALAGIPVER